MTTETISSGGETITRAEVQTWRAGRSDGQIALDMIDEYLDEYAKTKDTGRLHAAIGLLDMCSPVERDIAERRIAQAGGITLAAVRAQAKELEGFPMDKPVPVKSKAAAPATGVHLTEQGNGERFVRAFGEVFRWCEPWGKWLSWDDGKRWCPDATRAAERAAMTLPQLIDKEAAGEEDRDRRAALRTWANRSERIGTVRASLEFAKPLLAVTPDQLDRDGWLLNVNNGTIDLRTGELKPHDKADLITKLAPVDYDPKALCQRWEGFLCEIFREHVSLIDYIGRFAGLCLTADVMEHILLIAWGAGRNGKSIFFDTLLGMLGDYACRAPGSLFTVQRNAEHPTEIAGLQGKRLVVGSETEQGAQLRIQLIKQLTGDAALTGRFMRGDYFDFQRTFKLVLVTNHRPRIRDDSIAAWERVKLVPFTVQFLDGGERPPDKHLLETLKSEWPGILAWAVKGNLARLAEGGLGAPDAVKAATATYRAEEDPLAGFLGEFVALDAEAWTPLAQLRESFEAASDLKWGRIVTERLKQMGCRSQSNRYNGKIARGWSGIRLL